MKQSLWRKHIDRLDKLYEEWIGKIKLVPKDYPTLTEAQWLEACQHFNGCARCHNSIVDTRGFFIGAKSGGRYCDWNVIPLCEHCAKTWDLNKSMFIYTQTHSYDQKRSDYRDSLQGIVDYLGERLDNASRSGTEP